MTISSAKAVAAKVFTVGLLAGAVLLAAPQKASAQVSFGVRVGPVYAARGYVAPAPVYGYSGGYVAGYNGGYLAPAYVLPFDRDDFRRREFVDRDDRGREHFDRDRNHFDGARNGR